MWRCGTCISVIAVVKSLYVYNNSCLSVAVAGKGITTVFQSPNSKVRGPGYNTRAFIATCTLHRHFDRKDHAFINEGPLPLCMAVNYIPHQAHRNTVAL